VFEFCIILHVEVKVLPQILPGTIKRRAKNKSSTCCITEGHIRYIDVLGKRVACSMQETDLIMRTTHGVSGDIAIM